MVNLRSVGVLLLGAAMLTGALPGESGQPAAAATAATTARSSPVLLRIPALGVRAPVGPLGLKRDRTVQVPENPDHAGWYRFGPAPGQRGSAVILGHVDSKSGPAVFYRLRSLRTGDSIRVTLADGAIARFEVKRVVTYPNGKFPARTVYSSNGPPSLKLVTCGGRYDRRARSYTANVVVYASFVSFTTARR